MVIVPTTAERETTDRFMLRVSHRVLYRNDSPQLGCQHHLRKLSGSRLAWVTVSSTLLSAIWNKGENVRHRQFAKAGHIGVGTVD